MVWSSARESYPDHKGDVSDMSLASQVAAELRTRYARAVALQTPDAELWGQLAELAVLHRPVPESLAGQPRCA